MRFRSQLKINYDRLDYNYKLLQERVNNNQILFMVKANAYGHGLLPIVHFSEHELKIKEFGCATIAEAICVRENLSQSQSEIYVFSDFHLNLNQDCEYFLNYRLIPVISNLLDLESFLANKSFRNCPLVLKFNTGMNRLGIDFNQKDVVLDRLKRSPRRSIYHLMTHFACASQSMSSHSLNISQREKFMTLKSEFLSSGFSIERTSISNSGAIEQSVGLNESHIRPGIMLYGPSSLIPTIKNKISNPWSGKIISTLQSYVIHQHHLKKGDPVGYGGTPCPHTGQVSILALGYGDGLLNCYRGLEVKLNGVVHKVIGRISMDMIHILQIEEGPTLEVGMSVNLWDEDPEQFHQICQHTKMISYEVFCSISSRIPRKHL